MVFRDETEASAPECASCEQHVGRREFLRDAAIAAAVMLGLGARPGEASIVPRVLKGAGLAGGEVAYPLPSADGVSIDRQRAIIVARWQMKAYAFYLSCPHQRTVLHWIQSDQRFECPKHHSKYRPDGEYISGRATRGMDRYAVRIDSGQLLVDTGRLYRQDKDPSGWASAYVSVPPGDVAG